MDSADLRITRSRFLYAPSTGIRLKTTRRTSRGGTPYVNFANNTAEFGEAALFYTVWKSTSGAPRSRDCTCSMARSLTPHAIDAHDDSHRSRRRPSSTARAGPTRGKP